MDNNTVAITDKMGHEEYKKLMVDKALHEKSVKKRTFLADAGHFLQV
jgi:hypothetical protein